MNENKKIYTAADFADYYAGTMPVKQMYALEKAALEDPFLADALEGYVHTQTATADVEEIETRLFKKEKKKGVIIKVATGFWLRIAALLLFVGTAGYFFYWMNSKQQQINVAETKSNTQSNIDTNKNISAYAEPPKDNLLNTINGTLSQQEQPTQLADNSLPVKTPTASSKLVKDDFFSRDELKSVTPKASNSDEKEDYKKYFTQSGKVQDTTGAPVAFATVRDKFTKSATVTDELGRFKLKTADSSAIVSVSSVGYAAKEIVLEKNSPQSITLENRQAELSEVVVVGYGAKRQQKSISWATTSVSGKDLAKKERSDVANGLNGKVAGLNIQSSEVITSQPFVKKRGVESIKKQTDTLVANTTAFNEYVKNNKIPLFDENDIPQNGIVRLLFFVDKNGRPQNIEVVSSTCKACNAQAFALLKNGPVWPTGVLQYKYVSVTF